MYDVATYIIVVYFSLKMQIQSQISVKFQKEVCDYLMAWPDLQKRASPSPVFSSKGTSHVNMYQLFRYHECPSVC